MGSIYWGNDLRLWFQAKNAQDAQDAQDIIIGKPIRLVYEDLIRRLLQDLINKDDLELSECNFDVEPHCIAIINRYYPRYLNQTYYDYLPEENRAPRAVVYIDENDYYDIYYDFQMRLLRLLVNDREKPFLIEKYWGLEPPQWY